MWCLNVIGRDGWDRDTSMCWLDLWSSHGVGEEALSAVWLQAGLNSGRPCHEIIVVVVVVVGHGEVLASTLFISTMFKFSRNT